MLRFVLPLVAAIAFAARPAPGQPALRLGDPAPELRVERWLRGGPVALDPGRVYVLELCSTWSPTIRESAPFLTALQARYRDRASVLAVCVRETNRAAPAAFLSKPPGSELPIDYPIALDDVPRPPDGTPDDRVWAVEKGAMSTTWLKAAGRNTVPTAFIIDRAGHVAWIGNTIFPRGELEAALDQVLADGLTPEQSAALSEKFRAREQAEKDLDARWRRSVADGKHKIAVTTIDELVAIDEPFWLPRLAPVKFELLLTHLRDPAGAAAFATSALEGPLKDSPQPLNDMAWTMLTGAGVPKRDVDLALRLATRADEITLHQHPGVIDTLARAHRDKGDLDRAIALQADAVEVQRRTVDVAQNKEAQSRLLQQLEATLRRYQDERAKRR